MEAPTLTIKLEIDNPIAGNMTHEIEIDPNDVPNGLDAEGFQDYCDQVAECWYEENCWIEVEDVQEADEFLEQLELYRKYKDLNVEDLERMQELGMVG